MHNSYPHHTAEDLSNKDIIDIMCDKAARPLCKTRIRSVLGIEFEKELIEHGLLAELTKGHFVLTEHTSNINKYANYDGKCEYRGQQAYFEVKSTFSKLGTFKERRNIDILIMNNIQYSVLQQLRNEGYFVIIIMYYYIENILLLIDFRGTNFVRSTSTDKNEPGAKTFYAFETAAILKRFNNVLSTEFRSRMRTLQWEVFRKHEHYCSQQECRLKN